MVLTIVVLAVLTAMLASVVADLNADARATVERTEALRARNAADAGLAYALSILQRQQPGPATKLDEWFDAGGGSTDRFVLDKDSFRIQIVDAASLVNLNTASEEQLLNLGLTAEQASSLLDWREEGFVPRTEGAKDEYYNLLERPYDTKLRRLDSLDELLQVKGFGIESLIQSPEQSNVGGFSPVPLVSVATVDSFSPAAGQNINTATIQQLQQAGIPLPLGLAIIARRNQGAFTNMGDVLRVVGMTSEAAAVLVNSFRIGNQPRDEGRLNINTASTEALTSIPELTPDIADAIVSRQSAGFQGLGELLQIPGFTLQTLQATVDRLSTRSDVFIVRIEGLSGRRRASVEAIVRVATDRPRVLKLIQALEPDMRALWGWPDETSGDISLGEL
jgi:general secretion pathway protein K